MTMNDDTLHVLTDVLQTFNHLEDISLVGNVKLGSSRINSALRSFVGRVGKKCKVCRTHPTTHIELDRHLSRS
jgi:translation initiation factor 2 beta subunit (eIF-2beta)/eIF-5